MGSKEVQRQKTSINNDLTSDMLLEAGIGAPMKASKTKTTTKAAVLPPRRGNSLNPLRLKTQSNPDLTLGSKLGKRGETPTNTAGDSTAFSKRSNATRVNMEDDLARPQTEFLPSASQDFSDQIRPGRIRPSR